MENYVAHRMHEDVRRSRVSSDLRGEGVNFILGRFNYCVLIKHSYHKPKHCGCSNISAFASMKKTKHFVYVH